MPGFLLHNFINWGIEFYYLICTSINAWKSRIAPVKGSCIQLKRRSRRNKCMRRRREGRKRVNLLVYMWWQRNFICSSGAPSIMWTVVSIYILHYMVMLPKN